MIQNQVLCWQSPAAMRFILGAYALAGCIIALLARGWFTRGASLQTETQG